MVGAWTLRGTLGFCEEEAEASSEICPNSVMQPTVDAESNTLHKPRVSTIPLETVPRRGTLLRHTAEQLQSSSSRHSILRTLSAPASGFDPERSSMSLTSELGFVGELQPGRESKPRQKRGILPSSIDPNKVLLSAEVGFNTQSSTGKSVFYAGGYEPKVHVKYGICITFGWTDHLCCACVYACMCMYI